LVRFAKLFLTVVIHFLLCWSCMMDGIIKQVLSKESVRKCFVVRT
jgi:hypothetical protein